MSMIEYPAMVYKSNRNKVYLANCITKNIVGFGKSEQEAIENLRDSIQNADKENQIIIVQMNNFLMAQ